MLGDRALGQSADKDKTDRLKSEEDEEFQASVLLIVEPSYGGDNNNG